MCTFDVDYLKRGIFTRLAMTQMLFLNKSLLVKLRKV